MTPRLFPPPDATKEPRTAAAVIRRNALYEAPPSTMISATAFAGATAIWIGLGDGRLHSGTFFLLGMALLWFGSSARSWWTLRTMRVDAEATEARRADERAHLESVVRHRA